MPRRPMRNLIYCYIHNFQLITRHFLLVFHAIISQPRNIHKIYCTHTDQSHFACEKQENLFSILLHSHAFAICALSFHDAVNKNFHFYLSFCGSCMQNNFPLMSSGKFFKVFSFKKKIITIFLTSRLAYFS